MNIELFPTSIAQKSRLIIELEEKVLVIESELKTFESEIDRQVANDTTLTNDTKRKARKQELIAKDADIFRLNCSLISAKRDKRFAEIDLQELRDKFYVAMMMKRYSIAQMETDLKSVL